MRCKKFLFILLHVVALYPSHRSLPRDYVKTDIKLTKPSYLSYVQHNYYVQPDSLVHSIYRPDMLGTIHHLQVPQLDAHIVANDLVRSFYAQWLVQADSRAGVIKNDINVQLSSIDRVLKEGTTFDRFNAINQLHELATSFDSYCKELQHCSDNTLHADLIDINLFAAQCAREELCNVLNNIKVELFDKKTGIFLDRTLSKTAKKQITDYKQYKNIISAPDKDKLQRIENNKFNQALKELRVCFECGDLAGADKIMSQFASDRKLSKVLRNFKNSSPYFNEFGVPKVWEAHPKWNIYKQDLKAHGAQRDLLISILQHDHNNAQRLCECAGIVAPDIAQLRQAHGLQSYQNDPDFMTIISKSLQNPDTFDQTIHMLEQRSKALECIYTIAQQNLDSWEVLQEHISDLILFAQDPKFVSLVTDIVHNPDKAALLKSELFQREIYVQTFADKLGGSGFSYCAKQISYQLADVQSDLQRIEILSPLCIDHEQAGVRSAYYIFYDEIIHLPKIFNYDQELLKIILPKTIATQEFTNERALYTQIMVHPIACNEQRMQAQQCISFLYEACKTKSEVYRDLACTAAQTYLQPRNYIPENCTEQIKLFEQARIAVDQGLHKSLNNHVQKNLTNQTEVNYNQLHDHVAQQCMTLQEKTGSVSDYYQIREQVLAKVVAGDLAVSTQKYELCPQAQATLQKHALDPSKFVICTGNLLQQDTHAKLVASINKLAQKSIVTSAAQQIQEGVLECAQAGTMLNQQGKVQEAMLLADICHIAVDYVWQGIDIGVSVSKGVAKGVYSGIAAEINVALQDGTAPTIIKAGNFNESNLSAQVAAETSMVVADLVRFAKNAGEVALSGVAGVGDAIVGLPELVSNCIEMTQLTVKGVGYILGEANQLRDAAASNDLARFTHQLFKMSNECGQVVDGVSSYLTHLKEHPLLQVGPITHDDLKYCARVGGRIAAEGAILSHAVKGCTLIMEGALTYAKNAESVCGQLQHIKDVSAAQVRSAFLSADIALASPVAKVSSALGPEHLIERVITQAELTAPVTAEMAAAQEVTQGVAAVKDVCQSAAHIAESVQVVSATVNVQKKLDPKIMALTYATKELKEQVKPYLAEHKAKQQQLCTEHNVYKENRVHQVTDFKDDQKLWDAHAVSDLEIDKLAKPFDYTCRTHKDVRLPEHMIRDPKPIRFEHEHIRRPDIRVKCHKDVYSVSGFHHDPLGSLENSGLIDIIDKVERFDGCYKYKWKYGNSEFKPSTFFPKEWSPSKVYEKTLESLRNTVEIKYKEGATRYTHIGQTTEGLRISVTIEFNETGAQIVTSYPCFGE